MSHNAGSVARSQAFEVRQREVNEPTSRRLQFRFFLAKWVERGCAPILPPAPWSESALVAPGMLDGGTREPP